MQGAWVRSLVGELRSHMLHMAKKKKKANAQKYILRARGAIS